MSGKICVKPQCRKKYDKSHPAFEDGFCDCGAPLQDVAESREPSAKAVPDKKSTAGPPCFDKEGNVILQGSEQYRATPDKKKEETLKPADSGPPVRCPKGTHLLIYFNGQPVRAVELMTDESIFGRASTSSRADVDLTEFSPDKEISRQHLMIYRQNFRYYARNLSMTNSVHVNEKPLLFQQEDCELVNGDQIVLSGIVGLEFVENEEYVVVDKPMVLSEESENHQFSKNPDVYHRAIKIMAAFYPFPTGESLREYIKTTHRLTREERKFISEMREIRNRIAHNTIPDNLPLYQDIERLEGLLK